MTFKNVLSKILGLDLTEKNDPVEPKAGQAPAASQSSSSSPFCISEVGRECEPDVPVPGAPLSEGQREGGIPVSSASSAKSVVTRWAPVSNPGFATPLVENSETKTPNVKTTVENSTIPKQKLKKTRLKTKTPCSHAKDETLKTLASKGGLPPRLRIARCRPVSHNTRRSQNQV
jgi:hypothetical protein